MPRESPGDRRGSARRRPSGRRVVLLSIVASVLLARAGFADLWYEHYARAEEALSSQNWTLAVEELQEALERKGDSGARVRTYGMRVTAYFPYLKLGIAYYHLNQLEAALQAFETEERLGAIADSEAGMAELTGYRERVSQVRAQAAAEESRRIAEIVRQSLIEARDLETQGLVDESMAVVDRALAVAPDDAEALAAMEHLRQLLVERERRRETQRRVAEWVEEGRALLRQDRFAEAASRFHQVLDLEPSEEVRALLDEAQRRLRAELEATAVDTRGSAIAAAVEEVERLESEGKLGEALERVQTLLVLDPSNPEAGALQRRLLRQRSESEAERSRRATVEGLLLEADNSLESGNAEESLSAANRALALDPGNPTALEQVARAYRIISQRLLGRGATTNIPPAVRFVDLRSERSDGSRVETVRDDLFRLSGVVLDNTVVEVRLYCDEEALPEVSLESHPLGEFFVSEFHSVHRLRRGLSTFRLVARDSEGSSSSSEYAVLYLPPFYRTPGFVAATVTVLLVVAGVVYWERRRRLERLRKRKYNPYVAGAPVLDENMFFGRRELVDRILQTLHNNSLLLYGERRIGKTSIQHQIARRLRELEDPDYEFYPVYIDLQGTPEDRFFATLAGDLFEELAPVLGEVVPSTDPASRAYSYRDFVRDVHAVLRHLASRTDKTVKLVLLIDEVDALNDYDPRVNQKLRSLFMKSFSENLVSVVAGVEIKKQWQREGSPWYNFFEEIKVEPLLPDEARELVERPIRGLFKLDPGIAERIVSLTAGRPYQIQRVCIALVRRLYEQHRRRITLADVEAVGSTDEAHAA